MTPFDASQYRLPPMYEWVECERPEINEGLTRPLRIRVRINPSRAEVLGLAQQTAAIFQRAADRVKAAQEAGETVTGTDSADTDDDAELFRVIAPRIVEWNVQAETTDGELADVPPPADCDGQSLQLLMQRQQLWIIGMVQNAHLGGETRSKLSRPREVTDAGAAARMPSGPRIVDTPSGGSRRKPRASC